MGLDLALRFGPAVLAVVFFWLWLAAEKEVSAEIERCNTKIAANAAEAERTAREAVAEAQEREKARFDALMAETRAATEEAEEARQTASDAADGLRRELDAAYRQIAAARDWADTVLPDAVRERLREADRDSGATGSGGNGDNEIRADRFPAIEILPASIDGSD